MKKLISLILMATLMIGLTACKEEVKELTDKAIADALVENWDGDLTHLDLVLDNMDLEDSMVQITEFNLEIEENGQYHYLNEVVTDTYVYLESGTVLHRNITVDYDGTVASFDVIVEEVATGIIVYVNIDYMVTLIEDESGSTELTEILEMLGIDEEWIMFKFDDSIANIIELEVMKDLFVKAFYERFGPEFFYDLQEEVEFELGFDLNIYGVDFGVFIDHIVAAEYAEAELMLQNIDEEGLVLALDFRLLVPEIVFLLTDNQIALDLAGFDTVGRIAYLELNGTELFLDNLTDAEVVILLNVLVDANSEPGDPDLSDMYEAYAAGNLDHYLVMLFLDDPEVEAGLREIPGFDFDGFYTTMDLLDYDAMYLEVVDGEALFTAIYEGTDAYDAFVLSITATAPETAKLLTHLSPIVTVIEPLMVVIDDINYGIENLEMFADYFDMQYYLDIGVMDIGLEVTEEYEVETVVTLVGSAYSTLFEDLISDVYWYLDGFELIELPYVEHLNCPTGEICEPFAEYNEVINNLDMLGNMYYTATFNPSSRDYMKMEINFTEFVNELVSIETGVDGPVVDMSITVTVQESGSITIPEVVVDMNEVAEDFAKVSLTLLAYEMLSDVGDYYEFYTEETLNYGETRALDTFGDYLNPSFAFDANLSYVTVEGSILDPDYGIQLYWHDGTEVFVEDLFVSFLDFMEVGPPTRTDYLSLLSKVDEDNFSITKLLLVYIFMDFEFMGSDEVV